MSDGVLEIWEALTQQNSANAVQVDEKHGLLKPEPKATTVARSLETLESSTSKNLADTAWAHAKHGLLKSDVMKAIVVWSVVILEASCGAWRSWRPSPRRIPPTPGGSM